MICIASEQKDQYNEEKDISRKEEEKEKRMSTYENQELEHGSYILDPCFFHLSLYTQALVVCALDGNAIETHMIEKSLNSSVCEQVDLISKEIFHRKKKV